MKKHFIPLALLLLAACLIGCGAGAGADKAGAEDALCTYTVSCQGEDGAGIAGVMINFCTDSACTPVISGEGGAAVFTGAPEAYHVQIVSIPAGWEPEGPTEWTAEAKSQDFTISFREAGK